MKNKSTLALIELAVMLLVLSLAVALCLCGFVSADRITDATEVRDTGLSMAQRGAEAVKATRGDIYAASRLLSCTAEEGRLTQTDGDYTMTVTPRTEGLLGLADVAVTYKDSTVAELTASWQIKEVRDE